MEKKCAICDKGHNQAWARVRLRAGKYNPTIKRVQHPNLQWTRLLSGEKVLACAKCIKAIGKKKK
jgi:ribosomal protein L28